MIQIMRQAFNICKIEKKTFKVMKHYYLLLSQKIWQFSSNKHNNQTDGKTSFLRTNNRWYKDISTSYGTQNFVNLFIIKVSTRWRSWLRHCVTSRRSRVRFPMGVIQIFHWLNPSCRTMALKSTETPPGIFPKGKGGRWLELITLTHSCSPQGWTLLALPIYKNRKWFVICDRRIQPHTACWRYVILSSTI
jgi:hypothetical protein